MKTWRKLLLVMVGLHMLSPTFIFAQSSSPSFQINEYFLGPGGDQDLNSASYNARATLGDLGAGNYGSANYQIYSGFTTTDVPYLEFVVNGTNIDMGVLDPTTTGTGVATFSVRTYLSEGYVVYATGDLPTSESGATIDAIDPRAASAQGTEQFGFNLTANTSPTTFGALPQQVPDSTFSFGVVDDDYNDNGLFKYSTSEAIASSPSSSGETIYTASYIMNVEFTTEAGLYTTNQTFVATSTF